MSFRSVREEVRRVLDEALERLEYPSVEFNVDEPPRKELGDLYSNIAFLLSKKLKKKPRDIADVIVDSISKSSDLLYGGGKVLSRYCAIT